MRRSQPLISSGDQQRLSLRCTRLRSWEQPSPGDEDEGSVEGGDDNVD